MSKIVDCEVALTDAMAEHVIASDQPWPGFYLLGRGREGKLAPKCLSFPQKFFLKKNWKLFQILILFYDDIKESVKVTNAQNAISANPEHYLFKIFWGSMAPDPLKGLNNVFLAAAWLQKVL